MSENIICDECVSYSSLESYLYIAKQDYNILCYMCDDSFEIQCKSCKCFLLV
jgi:hypothetical protein